MRRLTDAALDAARRGAALNRRLLAFARRQALQPAALDVNALVAGMSDVLRRTLGERVEVETVLAGGLWPTLADPTELEAAVLNLAVNARDAMPEGGRLTVETANAHLDAAYAAAHAEVTPGQYVMLAVTDTGTGMPPAVVARAFEPFFTTKGIGRGTGLGLSQVYGFVKQSGGYVKIYSEVGQGTTVKVYLPRLSQAQAAVASAPVAAPTPPATLPVARPGETVLLVEDEPAVRAYAAEALRGLGYRVIEAPDGRAATEAAGDPAISLLLTDVGLPNGMTGRQVADAILARRPGLPVLFTTAYAPNAIVHGGVLDPGVRLLPKPFTAEELAVKVRQTLDAGSA
jgi:CheY-like chemotaxis protein